MFAIHRQAWANLVTQDKCYPLMALQLTVIQENDFSFLVHDRFNNLIHGVIKDIRCGSILGSHNVPAGLIHSSREMEIFFHQQ